MQLGKMNSEPSKALDRVDYLCFEVALTIATTVVCVRHGITDQEEAKGSDVQREAHEIAQSTMPIIKERIMEWINNMDNMYHINAYKPN